MNFPRISSRLGGPTAAGDGDGDGDGDETDDGTEGGVARFVGSGALGALGGGVTLLRAVRAYRVGDRKRAGLRALAAGVWFAGAAAQRRRRDGGTGDGATPPTAAGPGGEGSGPVDESDVVDTSAGDLEAAAGDGPDGDRESETDLDRSDVPGTGVDIEDAADGDEGERRSPGGQTESGDVDESDVVDTGPDYEGATDDGSSDGSGEAEPDADRGGDPESDGDEETTESESDEDGNPYDPSDFG